jgi:hypothetical protein
VVGEVPAGQVRMREEPCVENPDLDLRVGRMIPLREAATGVTPLRITLVASGVGPGAATAGIGPAAATAGIGAR